jgi:hypothetical protein
MSSANRDSLTSSLPICITFISSSCLIAQAGNSDTLLNRNAGSGQPYLIPDIRGNGFSFSPLSMMLAIGLSYIAFFYVEVHCFYSWFHQSFYHKMVLNFIKGFFCIYWDDQVVFVFASINVLYYIYWFVYVEQSLYHWDEANLVMVNDLSDMLLDSVCHYFIEDFCINVH